MRRSIPGQLHGIFHEAELNALHFREMEAKALRSQSLDNRLHRLLPFVLVLTCIVCCTLIATLASAAWGTVGFGATITAVMVTYLTGRAPPGGTPSS
jgi:peptidoglycan/LPS O-acetylase OafA/YrhL